MNTRQGNMLSQPAVFSPIEWAPVICQCRRCGQRRTHLHKVLLPEPSWLCGWCLHAMVPGPLLTSDVVDVLVEELPPIVTDVPGLANLPPAARSLLTGYLPSHHIIHNEMKLRRIPWTRNMMSMRGWNYKPGAITYLQLHNYHF